MLDVHVCPRLLAGEEVEPEPAELDERLGSRHENTRIRPLRTADLRLAARDDSLRLFERETSLGLLQPAAH